MAKNTTPVKGALDINTLHRPLPSAKTSDRKLWGIGLGGVWVPYFMAQNAAGVTNIPHDVLGAPLRLAREKDGTPRFTQSGRPVLRVQKPINDEIRVMRENFAFGLMAHTQRIQKEMPEAYKAQVEAAQRAGVPLIQKDRDDLDAYIALLTEAEAAAKGEAAPPADNHTETPIPAYAGTVKELVAA